MKKKLKKYAQKLVIFEKLQLKIQDINLHFFSIFLFKHKIHKFKVKELFMDIIKKLILLSIFLILCLNSVNSEKNFNQLIEKSDEVNIHSATNHPDDEDDPSEIKVDADYDEFRNFKKKYKKKGKKQELLRKFKNFKHNKNKIDKLRKKYGDKRGKFGLTKYSDLEDTEFQKLLTLKLHSEEIENIKNPKIMKNKNKTNSNKFKNSNIIDNNILIQTSVIPDTFSWTSTPIKDQGKCGGCFAFTIVGVIESLYIKKTLNKIMLDLSEQSIIDCSQDKNDGCSGGYIPKALEFIKIKGLMYETYYPYEGIDDTCFWDPFFVALQIKSYFKLSTKDENEIKTLLFQNGPLVGAINAIPLQAYTGGILDLDSVECDPTNINQGVILIGFGVENNEQYWLLRNSWGPDWGENGFFRIKFGSNICGVSNYLFSIALE